MSWAEVDRPIASGARTKASTSRSTFARFVSFWNWSKSFSVALTAPLLRRFLEALAFDHVRAEGEIELLVVELLLFLRRRRDLEVVGERGITDRIAGCGRSTGARVPLAGPTGFLRPVSHRVCADELLDGVGNTVAVDVVRRRVGWREHVHVLGAMPRGQTPVVLVLSENPSPSVSLLNGLLPNLTSSPSGTPSPSLSWFSGFVPSFTSS